MKYCRWVVSQGFVLALTFFLIGVQSGFSQANSWISSSSGDWESPQWSLGLPQLGDDIFITNAGVKTIVIEPNTVEYYSGTMAVNSVTLAAPTGSSNALYLNNAGFQMPLSMGTLSVGNDSAVELDNSWLVVTNGISLEGAAEFLQDSGTNATSTVAVRSGSGYMINGGELDGGLFVFPSATFKQTSGTANLSQVSVDGSFMQSGGILNATNPTTDGMSLPELSPFMYDPGASGTASQTGGTNNQFSLTLGVQQNPPLNQDTGQNLNFGSGTYNLSNGLLSTGNTYIWSNGSMEQSGGVNSIAGNLSLSASVYLTEYLGGANQYLTVISRSTTAGYSLSGGVLQVSNVNIGVYGGINQTGGTNIISNTLGYSYVTAPLGNDGKVLTYISGSYTLSGGLLSVSNLSAIAGGQFNMSAGQLNAQNIYGNVSQSGGTAMATTVSANYSLNNGTLHAQSVGGIVHQSGGLDAFVNLLPTATYSISGGVLSAPNLAVTGGGLFQHGGGTLTTTLLTLDDGTWQELTNGSGVSGLQLQLGAGTNSMILFANKACLLHFAGSSNVNWANIGVLTVVGWNGSTNGLGTNVLMFGGDATGLTGAQLSQIQFANPAGLPAGNYAAKILSNGEVVPSGPSYLDNAPGPFFTGEASVGSDWYYLSTANQVYGYYSLAYFPYVYHADMGWEYFIDAGDAQHGAYFYDFTDGAWIYTQPASFPYIYDFNQNAWLYYLPGNEAGRYTSNPRWFYNFTTQTWVNNL